MEGAEWELPHSAVLHRAPAPPEVSDPPPRPGTGGPGGVYALLGPADARCLAAAELRALDQANGVCTTLRVPPAAFGAVNADTDAMVNELWRTRRRLLGLD
eukprot:TRINITY_DN22834_c0_g1_i1.p4 TRINITY_DN22834_c0_g1~~TRINITY_DN22834_c0_g1_i1.p4  ORF type:complete len:101 (+),score=20.62 TRINITY_DN22834_c0_g1_i1:862-1164(+)